MIHNVPIIAELATICREYWNKISILEGDKYDLEMIEQLKKWEVKSETRTSFNSDFLAIEFYSLFILKNNSNWTF